MRFSSLDRMLFVTSFLLLMNWSVRICNVALIADAKFGEPNVPAIQTSLTQIISSVEFSIEDLAEIQALFNATGLNQIYTLG